MLSPDWKSFSEWAAFANERCEGSLVEPVLRSEEVAGRSRAQIYSTMRTYLSHMRMAARRSLGSDVMPVKAERLTIMDGLDSARVCGADNFLADALGRLVNRAQAYALATSEAGASGLPIVKSPTAGSVGVIPGAFLALSEEHSISDKEMADALLVSAGIGNIIFSRATFAAAVAGCGAEVGVATCMAAGGLAWLVSKKAECVESAASIAMQNYLGLECSSVAGAVEVPCAYRCALGAVSALTSANMACAGVIFQVPLDEVIDVMYEVGQALPNGFRETQGAGLAKTPTGVRLAQKAYTKRKLQLACLNCNGCAEGV